MLTRFINDLAGGKLILLDKKINGITRPYSAVYENFEKDIYDALKEALPNLEKYKTLKIVFPADNYFPDEILKGFHLFCNNYAFEQKVVYSISEENIQCGDVYINLMEDDLIVLLGKIRETQFEVGKDVGIISYNETPWKKFILNGITTVSTDFVKMGEMAAAIILDKEVRNVEIPFTLTLRNSL